MVEPVEEFRTELGAELLVWTKLRILEDGKVKVLHPVTAYVRLGTRIGAVAVIVGMREHGCVKPMGEPLVQRTGGQLRQGRSRIAGTAHVRDTGVAEQSGASADDNRLRRHRKTEPRIEPFGRRMGRAQRNPSSAMNRDPPWVSQCSTHPTG